MVWTGLSECDQSELGLIVNGETQDPEALNRLIEREQQMLELAAQVAKHGPGYGQEPLQSTDGSTALQKDCGLTIIVCDPAVAKIEAAGGLEMYAKSHGAKSRKSAGENEAARRARTGATK